MKKKRDFVAPASIWKRFLAFFIDMIILNFIVLLPFASIYSRLIPNKSFTELVSYAQSPAVQTTLLKVNIASGILVLIYFFYFEFKSYQTPGKMLLGLKLISTTKEVSWWQFLVSNLLFLYFIPFVGLFFIFDIAYLFFSPKNQRFLEKISNLLLVQELKG